MRYKLKLLARILRFPSGGRLYMALSLLTAAVTVALTLAIPALTGAAVDAARGYGDIDINGITRILLLIGASAVVMAAVQWLMSIINNRLAFNAAESLRVKAFEKIGRLEIKTLDENAAGDIVSRVMADVDALSDGVLLGFTHLFTGVLTILGTLLFMLITNRLIALAVVAVTPLSLVVSAFIAKKTYSMYAKTAESRGELYEIADECVSGKPTIAAFSLEDKMIKRFAEANVRHKDRALRAVFFSSITNPSTRFVNSTVYALVAVLGALMVAEGEHALTVGGLTCMLTYAGQYAKPFNEISGVVAEFQNALASAARVFSFIELDELPPDPETPAQADGSAGDVRFENVCFSYDKSRKLIENLNLHVKSGMRAAIVGPTGCGKTTIINLLMRFYEPDSGSIFINGVNAKDYAISDLRAMYGMVLQDTWLRADTVKENIRFGNPDATDEQVVLAAKAANAHGFITRLKDGYDTRLSEDGGGLSQGQKQLLCIARVMLTNPAILILDEATSSIDTRTELVIQRAFLNLMKGRTAFIVAHRLSTILSADIILAMRDGRIVEMGSHAELMRKNGFYAELYLSQYK